MKCAMLLTHWQDSLKLFQRATFSTYLLSCLNTIKISAPYMLIYFWWAYAGLLLLHIGKVPSMVGALPNLGASITVILHIVLLFGYIATMRSSIEPKGKAYYLAQLEKTLWAVAVSYLLVGPYFLPLVGLVLLFFFDSTHTGQDYLRSWQRTAKAFFYLLPAALILGIGKTIINICWYKITYILDAYLPGISIPLLAIIHFVNYASLTVFYLRLKHTYFNLIFE
jgi:hypothetical protein